MPDDAAMRLESAIEKFAVPLRMGDGIDEPALDDLKQVLAQLAEQWHDAGTVPKYPVALLIELYPALVGTVALYEGDQAERVQAVCEEMLELSLTCVTEEG